MPKLLTCVECGAGAAAVNNMSDDDALNLVAQAFPNGCPYCRRATDGTLTDPRSSLKVKAVHDKQDDLLKKQGGSRNCFKVEG